MQLTGAQIVIECMKEQGVDTVFGYPGGAILNVYDELYKHSDEIKHILVSHEQGASHAADGYARATGKTGVCFATSGPGSTNLVTGIATANIDSIPVVAITCNVGTALLGKDSFQEVSISEVVKPITKASFIVMDVNDLADTIRKAFEIEAEKMNLHGYEYESNSAAFGGACVSANNSGNGTVKAEFGGESGKHDLTIYYFDENDGNAEFEFYINGNHITSWTADKDLGSASADIKTLTTYIIKDIELSKGDIISIVGRKEKYDPARLDRIVIDEEEATKPNDPTGITDDSIVWDFSAYTDEISATEENYTELYNGLTIALNSNGADSDHDSISSAGVYWRGGVPNGESTVRYISYTPEVDGILCASGKTANSDGAWGISISKDVSDLTSGSGKS